MCDTDEVLQTSWLLRQRAGDCSDKFLITTFGETKFKRQLETNKPKEVVDNWSATEVSSTEFAQLQLEICKQIMGRNCDLTLPFNETKANTRLASLSLFRFVTSSVDKK